MTRASLIITCLDEIPGNGGCASAATQEMEKDVEEKRRTELARDTYHQHPFSIISILPRGFNIADNPSVYYGCRLEIDAIFGPETTLDGTKCKKKWALLHQINTVDHSVYIYVCACVCKKKRERERER